MTRDPTMRPLQFVALGWLVIAIDLRVGQTDVVADPVGWAVALYGMFRVAGRGPWLRASLYAGIAAGAISVAAWFPGTSWENAADLAASVAEPVVIVLMLTGLIASARVADDTASASRLSFLRSTVLICLFGTVIIGLAVGSGPVLLVLILINLAVLVWYMVTMYQLARRKWAQPAP